jgi:hypothetical protein
MDRTGTQTDRLKDTDGQAEGQGHRQMGRVTQKDRYKDRGKFGQGQKQRQTWTGTGIGKQMDRDRGMWEDCSLKVTFEWNIKHLTLLRDALPKAI